MDPFYIALILYVLAIVLALLDIFVPSGGMLMILAAAAGVGSILFGFRSSTTLGMAMLTVVAGSFPVLAVITVKIWPHTPIGRMIILKLPNKENGRPARNPLEDLVGKVFLVDGSLMPAGQVKVGHRHINAIAEHGIIEQGQAVKVVSVRARNLIVRPTLEPVSQVASPRIKRLENPTAPTSEQASGLNEEVVDSELLDRENFDRELLDRPATDLGLDSLDK